MEIIKQAKKGDKNGVKDAFIYLHIFSFLILF